MALTIRQRTSPALLTCCDVEDVKVISLRSEIGGVNHQAEDLTGLTYLL